MTNEQRDELLISIAKGLNNLQGAFNDFRVEIRAELNTKVDALDQKLSKRIDDLEKSQAEFREETKAHFEALEKSQAEFRKETKANFKAVSDVVRDIFKTNYEADKHLKRHDIEIQELQSKLA